MTIRAYRSLSSSGLYARSLRLVLLLCLIIGVRVALAPHVHAAPETFIVNSTADTDDGSCTVSLCTLRDAVEAANNNGNPADQDVIDFNISGSGVQTIQLTSDLNMTQSVLIDGYTQGVATPNTALAPLPFNGTLLVQIDNSVNSGDINVESDSVTLRGLVINGGQNGEINATNVANFQLYGDYIDVDPTGLIGVPGANDDSINLFGVTDSSIGGSGANQRNIISSCSTGCIYVGAGNTPTTNLSIQGNYIGDGADGITDLGSVLFQAVFIDQGSQNVLIGGTTPGDGNSIENNNGGGIEVQNSSAVSILGNRIVGNYSGAGIQLDGGSDVQIGDGTSGGSNVISGEFYGYSTNTGQPYGVLIADSTTSVPSTDVTIDDNNIGVMEDGTLSLPNQADNIFVQDNSDYVAIENNNIMNDLYDNGVSVTGNAQNVSILQNSIYNNHQLGIDLGDDGVTQNDPGDTDTGPNGLLNYPEYNSITQASGNTTINYQADLLAGNYRVEFFSNAVADPSGHGQGQTYLGFQNITSTGSGVQDFSTTLTGVTNVTNLALTATVIDPNNPSGFGPTSEFGGVAPPVSDIGITKVLNDPQDLRDGATISYTLTLTNHGPDSIDLATYTGSQLGENDLFLDLLPPELTYDSVSGADVACSPLGAGSASLFGPLLANHSDYELVPCTYTGGSNILTAGQSFTATITATINSGADVNFLNYVIAPLGLNDPDTAAFDTGASSGQDIIDYFINNPNNNFARSEPFANLTVTKKLIDPEDVTPGHTISYDVTLSNSGPQGVNLTDYESLQRILIEDFYPAADLTYASVTNPDVLCEDIGPGSSAYLGAAAQNHSSGQLVVCLYQGASHMLDPGDSYTLQINFTVNQNVGSTFTNYAFQTSTANDPDNAALEAALSGNTDILDTLVNGNFARSVYPAPSSNSNSGSSSGAKDNSSNSDLPDTGEDVVIFIVVATLLIIIGLNWLVYALRTKRLR